MVRTDVEVTLRKRSQLITAVLLLARVGYLLQTTYIVWQAYQISKSAHMVAFAGQCIILPTLLLYFVSGAAVDQCRKRSILLVTQTVNLVVAFTLTYVSFTSELTVNILLVAAVVLGSTRAFDMPAQRALVQQVVGKSLRSEPATNSAMIAITWLCVALWLAVLNVLTSNGGWAYATSAACFFATLLYVKYLKLSETSQVFKRTNIFAATVDSWRSILQIENAQWLIGILTAFSLLGYAVKDMLSVAIVHPEWGGGTLGIWLTMYFVGFLWGSIRMYNVPEIDPQDANIALKLLLVVLAGSLTLSGLGLDTPSFFLTSAGLLCVGMTTVMAGITIEVAIFRAAGPEMRGRATSLISVIVWLSLLLGCSVQGWFSGQLGFVGNLFLCSTIAYLVVRFTTYLRPTEAKKLVERVREIGLGYAIAVVYVLLFLLFASVSVIVFAVVRATSWLTSILLRLTS